MSHRDVHHDFDHWEIISVYQPEVIPNERTHTDCPPEAFETFLRQFIGTENYHADSGLLLTDGVKWLLDAMQGYVLLEFIREHLQTIGKDEGAFTVIDLIIGWSS